MATNNAPPKLLSIPELAGIHVSHPPIGKAIQAILDYVNKNVTPPQGNKIAKR